MEVEDQDEWGDYPADQGTEDWAAEDEREALAFQAGALRPSFTPCTTQYCIDKNISHTHSLEDATKGNPRTGFLVKEALEAKEKGEELSSSIIIVRKVEKENQRAKAKAAEEELDVSKAKEERAKWAREKMENLLAIKEAHLSATFAWR